MYPALAKRHLLRPSTAQVTQLARASVHNKAHSNMKPDEEFFVNTTFPDDFENSTMLRDELRQKEAEAKASKGPWDKATIEAHKQDIFESLYPHDAKSGKAPSTSKQKKAQPEPERAPELDEM
ncbi:hypothetical protein N7466_011152 [Penicillium verhagenii]|uniref:uncharacterized protein n=1 Tax=Penicillium verhagenii TaxID=1562060 RepID=UPI002544DB72|nr:uncharacterized protein N7466_011152 [Penicillium verhagenii]KAJ5917598.1 hypothetical protein N7466_011152 [Penicillium verhagenii]